MASSVVRAEDIDREFLQCALCIDRLQKPKVLPCQHTFCVACLELWVAKNNNQLSCPVCRNEYQLPDGGVNGLPDNFFVNSIIDFIGRKRQVSATALTCHGCENEASYYCQNCEEELCFDCAGAHRRLRLTKNHKLTSLEEHQVMLINTAIMVRYKGQYSKKKNPTNLTPSSITQEVDGWIPNSHISHC